MKAPRSDRRFIASILCTLLPVAMAFAQDVIVDTKFDQHGADGVPLITPDQDAVPPLNMPSGVVAMESIPEIKTTVVVSDQTQANIAAPCLKIDIGMRPNSTATANGGVFWKFPNLAISKGVYEITYQAAAMQEDKSGGRFIVAVDTTKSAPDSGGTMSKVFPLVAIAYGQGGILVVSRQGVEKDKTVLITPMKYTAGEAQKFRILLNLEKQVWSAEVDGQAWVEDQPFPDFVNTGAGGDDVVGSVRFTTEGGHADPAESSWILGPVLMRSIAP